MPNGYMGKILWVSLSDLKVSTLNTMDYAENYIGGKGIATRIFWDKAKPRIEDGLDPENLLIFMTGPLSGTLSPSSGRTTTCFKSLVQWPKPWFSWSNFGGEWGPELKFAGYDGVVLHGKADHPVYIWIKDGVAKLCPAEKLWGKTSSETINLIASDRGEKKCRTICIGPAGENRVRYACVVAGSHNFAGRTGLGAVMGAKNLKAISVRGKKRPELFDKDAFMEAREKTLKTLKVSSQMNITCN